MARQKGIIKIHGKIDDLSFYESQDGFIVRKKGGINKSRIAKDPKFARTRENNSEFKEAATAGKALRDSVRTLMLNVADSHATARLLKIMTEIKNMDSVSGRGARNVSMGLSQPGTVEILKGFDFNVKAPLSSKLFKSYDLDPTTGILKIADLVTQQHIAAPPTATHVELRSGWAVIDFSSGKSQLVESNIVNLPINMNVSNVTLTPSSQPSGPGTNLFFLKIMFNQVVNGVPYALTNSSHNVLTIVDGR